MHIFKQAASVRRRLFERFSSEHPVSEMPSWITQFRTWLAIFDDHRRTILSCRAARRPQTTSNWLRNEQQFSKIVGIILQITIYRRNQFTSCLSKPCIKCSRLPMIFVQVNDPNQPLIALTNSSNNDSLPSELPSSTNISSKGAVPLSGRTSKNLSNWLI